jgi:hypothetical protein
MDGVMTAYEELRQAVLDRRIARAQAQALAVFVRQGLLGWVTAWSQCAAVRIPSDGARPAAPRAATLADDMCPQLVQVLADMVLGETPAAGRGGG